MWDRGHQRNNDTSFTKYYCLRIHVPTGMHACNVIYRNYLNVYFLSQRSITARVPLYAKNKQHDTAVCSSAYSLICPVNHMSMFRAY